MSSEDKKPNRSVHIAGVYAILAAIIGALITGLFALNSIQPSYPEDYDFEVRDSSTVLDEREIASESD